MSNPGAGETRAPRTVVTLMFQAAGSWGELELGSSELGEGGGWSLGCERKGWGYRSYLSFGLGRALVRTFGALASDF